MNIIYICYLATQKQKCKKNELKKKRETQIILRILDARSEVTVHGAGGGNLESQQTTNKKHAVRGRECGSPVNEKNNKKKKKRNEKNQQAKETLTNIWLKDMEIW